MLFLLSKPGGLNKTDTLILRERSLKMSKEMKEMLSRLLGDDVDVIPDFDILEDKETRDFIFSVI